MDQPPEREDKSRKNAGETFSEEHQEQYKTMEKQSRPELPEDISNQVPRLSDVLTKRRQILNQKQLKLSTAQLSRKLLSSSRKKIASANKDETEAPHYDSECDACRNLRCLEILQRLDLKPRCPSTKKTSNHRVEKYRNRRQHTAARKAKQPIRGLRKKDLKRITKQCGLSRCHSKRSKDTGVRSRTDVSNAYSTKTLYPDSKNPSVTSYHSFGSMSEEPMV